MGKPSRSLDMRRRLPAKWLEKRRDDGHATGYSGVIKAPVWPNSANRLYTGPAKSWEPTL